MNSSARESVPYSGESVADAPLFDGPILVTGATGFLGGHLVRRFLDMGQPVRATGRNLKTGLEIQAAGADFRPVDLRDRAGMISACEGVAAVVHSGALSSAWGRYTDFYDINVRGTENVIEACITHGVARLVYISSPSVMTRPEDQFGLSESDTLPETFVSMYSETKKLAEDRVNAARANELKAVILRPKAIYGPGDNAIFPRLIEAASKKRLPIIGDGEAVTNLTHVNDVVEAIILALTRDEALGNTYVITGGEDVRMWDVIKEVVVCVGHEAPTKRLSLTKAKFAAEAMEFLWRTLYLPGEPLLTKYKVGILGMSQTYDISAARSDLGYVPRVTIKQGIENTLDSLRSGQGIVWAKKPIRRTAETRVGIRIRTAGTLVVPARMFLPAGGFKRILVPALYAILDHPSEGLILWDTGYSPRFIEGTRRFPFRIMRWLTPARPTEADSVVFQLRTLGYHPDDVKWVLMSHFDPDHYGGLKDFPRSRVMCSAKAWENTRDKKGWAAFRSRILPGNLPDDLAGRLFLLPGPDGPVIGDFESSLDIFGDSSIRVVELPGHAAGQLGAFVRRTDGTDVFLAADGCWNRATLEAEGYRGGLHRMLAVDKPAQDETYRRLRRLRNEWPELIIVPSHCPRAWRELGELEESAR
ncbi:MAG: NAD-dependent epimerase/dehydratase family protein [Candidatus Hydrogenedentota bacterium]